jgi:predicted P-loop ATPase
MTAVFCRNAKDRSADTWKKQLEPFSCLEFALSDAAKGIGAAVAGLAQARDIASSAPALTHGLDVFHTTMAAKRVLAPSGRRVEAAWERAEAADAKVATAKRQGIDARGAAAATRAPWANATVRFEQAERLERAWSQVHTALDRFSSPPTADSTTAPAPRPRSPRRFGI